MSSMFFYEQQEDSCTREISVTLLLGLRKSCPPVLRLMWKKVVSDIRVVPPCKASRRAFLIGHLCKSSMQAVSVIGVKEDKPSVTDVHSHILTADVCTVERLIDRPAIVESVVQE